MHKTMQCMFKANTNIADRENVLDTSGNYHRDFYCPAFICSDRPWGN